MLEAAILDTGLDLAMEWGDQWLMPIQARLALLHPNLGALELELYNEACGSAMRFGHELVIECLTQTREDEALFDIWSETMQREFPWISPERLNRLFSQGRYYAWKDGA